MIDPKQLRIGNWVLVEIAKSLGETEVKYRSERVDSIFVDGINMEWDHEMSDYTHAEKVRPILLTPEILEKCGFSDRGFTNVGFFKNYWLPNKWTICYCIKTTEIHTSGLYYAAHANDIEVKYLHQLQNLYFALTGTELNYSPE